MTIEEDFTFALLIILAVAIIKCISLINIKAHPKIMIPVIEQTFSFTLTNGHINFCKLFNYILS